MEKRILIIEDDKDITDLVDIHLSDLGYMLDKAYDGESGLSKSLSGKYDLVILDLMLPKLEGLEVCKRIKNNPQTAEIPIIMVTALSEIGDIERAINSGTDDFLSKPVNKWELLTRVKTMLKLKHLTDQLERTLTYLNEIEEGLHQ